MTVTIVTLLLSLGFLPLAATASAARHHASHSSYPLSSTRSHHFTEPLTRLAFGSCSHQNKSQSLWRPILDAHPQAFVWLGDTVYADHYLRYAPFVRWAAEPEHIQRQFDVQKRHVNYSEVVDAMPVLGVWDDHDMGENDGNRFTPHRETNQQLFLDFFNTPTDDVRRHREGLYTSFTFGPRHQRVRLILTDIRYFQDYESEDMLGPEQWRWLEKQIVDFDSGDTDGTDSGEAALILFASSIQLVTHTRPIGEGWRHFPKSRQRLFAILAKVSTPVLFLSGDVHYGEIERSDTCSTKSGQLQVRPLVEVTSSGMTHSMGRDAPLFAAIMPMLLGKPIDRAQHTAESLGFDRLCTDFNFGLLSMDWQSNELQSVRIQLLGQQSKPCIDVTLPLQQLAPTYLAADTVVWPGFSNRTLGSSGPSIEQALHRCQYERFMDSRGRQFHLSGIQGFVVVLSVAVLVITLLIAVVVRRLLVRSVQRIEKKVQ